MMTAKQFLSATAQRKIGDYLTGLAEEVLECVGDGPTLREDEFKLLQRFFDCRAALAVRVGWIEKQEAMLEEEREMHRVNDLMILINFIRTCNAS